MLSLSYLDCAIQRRHRQGRNPGPGYATEARHGHRHHDVRATAGRCKHRDQRDQRCRSGHQGRTNRPRGALDHAASHSALIVCLRLAIFWSR